MKTIMSKMKNALAGANILYVAEKKKSELGDLAIETIQNET